MIAHGPVAPSELWSSWNPEPTVVVGLLLAAVVYARGYERLRTVRRPPVGAVHAACFAGALAALVVALLSPLDAAAASLFSAHMIQHLILMVVAAPLLVMAHPVAVLTRGVPRVGRHLIRRLRSLRAVRPATAAAGHPVSVWVVGTVVLWVWHLPLPYEAAVRHDGLHALEHATLVGVSALLWSAVLDRRRHPLAVPAAVALLFATGLQGAALGAILTLAPDPLYGVHEASAPLWGLSIVEDQQLAGVLMWVPPGLVYLAVVGYLLAQWFRSLEAPMAPAGPRPLGEEGT